MELHDEEMVEATVAAVAAVGAADDALGDVMASAATLDRRTKVLLRR